AQLRSSGVDPVLRGRPLAGARLTAGVGLSAGQQLPTAGFLRRAWVGLGNFQTAQAGWSQAAAAAPATEYERAPRVLGHALERPSLVSRFSAAEQPRTSQYAHASRAGGGWRSVDGVADRQPLGEAHSSPVAGAGLCRIDWSGRRRAAAHGLEGCRGRAALA